MDADRRYPGVPDLEAGARKRLPLFAWEYLAGGIGVEACLARNRQALDDVQLLPRYLSDEADQPRLETRVLGQQFDAPFGVAPVGLAGLMWPRASEILAAAARRHNLPFTLSMFATTTLEKTREIAADNAWLQLYLPNRPEIEHAILERARAAGYEVLVITVDLPTVTRRAREIRHGLSVPPRFDAATLLQILARPAWAFAMLRAGIPRFENLQPYLPPGATAQQQAQFFADFIEGHVSMERLARVRERWPGKLVVKGILAPQDARACVDSGIDALVVSNHGGRQLDSAPAPVDRIRAIRDAAGDGITLLADSGARSGLDIARMIACGADLVLLGRAFIFSVACLGDRGGDHAMRVLKEEYRMTLAQLGCPSNDALPGFLHDQPASSNARAASSTR